jgi:transcriptional regulator with XRE-family HTH domain
MYKGTSANAAIRHRRGLSLEQISKTTKISIRFLKAIETEQFRNLPGGIYNKSYIRQYAQAIGIDEDDILSRYELQALPAPRDDRYVEWPHGRTDVNSRLADGVRRVNEQMRRALAHLRRKLQTNTR